MARPNRIVIAATISFVAPIATAAGNDPGPTLDQRLERMAEQLEERRIEFHVPGMAIAVVKDDRIVFSRGFGVTDIDSGEAVTDQTLFAAGSTTKAFTAALAGMLVDDDRMSWDDPVRKHLPNYRIKDAAADAEVSIRDLLCHRIGFASMTLLWYGNDVSSGDVLATSLDAELLYPFRETWNYSNISFLAAGLATAEAAGSDWESLIAERIFRPLGMSSTNTSIDVALADPRMATGYRWDAESTALVRQPMRSVAGVAPAGAINSSVRDMAQWVRFQLARGTFDGKRLLSEEQHAETWTEQMTVGGGIGYGLGWFLRDDDGRRVIEHAGGIDGFTAEVAMLPDEQLGFVLLMNLFASPLQDASRQIVFDSLLGDLEDDAPADDEDIARFLGTYVGNFGQFRDARFQVLVQNDRLAVDVPGQMVFELHAADDEGRRAFTLTDAIAVRFNEADDGEVYSLTIFQAGYEFELPRQGMEMPVEIDLTAVTPYLGTYGLDETDTEVSVLVHNNRLAVDVPDQMIYELRRRPDEDGRWVFRVKDTLWVTFDLTDSGDVANMMMTQDGVETILPRRSGPATTVVDLPTTEEVLSLVRKAQGGDGVHTLRLSGQVRFVHMGVTGSYETVQTRDGRYRSVIDLGRFGHITSIVDGERGWLDSTMLQEVKLTGEMLEQMKHENLFLWHSDWRDMFEEIRVVERTDFGDRPVFAVRLQPTVGEPTTMLVDVETGLPAGRRLSSLNPLGMRIDLTQRMTDYREIDGLLIPHRIEIENAMSGSTVIEIESVESNVEVSEEMFRMSADAAE